MTKEELEKENEELKKIVEDLKKENRYLELKYILIKNELDMTRSGNLTQITKQCGDLTQIIKQGI